MKYYIVDNFIPKETCNILKNYKIHAQNNIVNGVELGYDNTFHELSNIISDNIREIIFDNFSCKSYIDNYMVRNYKKEHGQKNGMPMHVDNVNWSDDAGHIRYIDDRIYTSVINLNSNYIGGIFLIEDIKIPPSTGKLIILNSSLLHGVSPMIAGTRFSFLFWYSNRDHKLTDFKQAHLDSNYQN